MATMDEHGGKGERGMEADGRAQTRDQNLGVSPQKKKNLRRDFLNRFLPSKFLPSRLLLLPNATHARYVYGIWNEKVRV